MSHTNTRTPSLRRAVLTMLTLGLLLLTAVQYLLAGNFFERQLQDVEAKDAFARLRNLHHALAVLSEDLSSTTTDWSQWDTAYSYVTGDYPTFAADNLTVETITRLRLSFFVVIGEDGRALFARSVSPDGKQLLDAPADIVRMASGTDVLSGHRDPMHYLTGLVATSSGVYLVSSQPVRSSEPGKSPRGRVVMGRSLNGFVVPALMRMTGEPLEVKRAGAGAVAESDGSVYRRNDRDMLFVNGAELSGYTPLDDLWGRPVAQLHMHMKRPTLATLADTQAYLLGASLIVGLLFCVAALIFVRSRLIVPLEQFAGAVGTIGETGRAGARVPAQSSQELETLGRAINGMLRQIEQQQSIQRDRDAALEANRLKSEFLATMSHEIRTPMNGVLGMCELLQRTELDPRQRHLSDTILRSARSLLEILNDILDFSKIESGRLDLESATFSPADIVSTASAPFAAAAQGKGLDFTVRVATGVPALLVGDALRLRQILTNLLSNAIKFTDQGSVSVACSLGSVGSNHAELRFAVSDSGIGIPAAAQERIFEPFAQAETNTSRRYGGTGLGLAIVRRLVTAMGGSIELRSAPGRGSTFAFNVILQAVPEQEPVRIAHADATGPRFSLSHAPSILLAEDNAVNREVLTEMLEHIGCRVTAVENGALVLAAAAERTFDVILMDCQMPVMDGHTAASELRALERAASQRPTFIIALTADATAENRRRCIDAGMNEVVTKPISQANLRDLIMQAVRPSGLRPQGATCGN